MIPIRKANAEYPQGICVLFRDAERRKVVSTIQHELRILPHDPRQRVRTVVCFTDGKHALKPITSLRNDQNLALRKSRRRKVDVPCSCSLRSVA